MYEKILVPLDGSTLSEAVLPKVKEMALRLGSEVVLFQAVSLNLDRILFPDEHSSSIYLENGLERSEADAEAYLEEVARNLKHEGVTVRIVVRLGDPADGILRTAEAIDADLIAMSTHGRTGLGRLIHGSVAARVLCNTIRPVVLIRPNSKVPQAV